MHVSALSVDLNWFPQFVLSALLIALGFLYLLKNTASKYFVVDAAFDPTTTLSSTSFSLSLISRRPMPGVAAHSSGGRGRRDYCAVCGKATNSQCSRCKAVKYCSVSCQHEHWISEHRRKCKELQLLSKSNMKHMSPGHGISLVPLIGSSKVQKQVDEVLFPYDDFINLFNWDKSDSPPCGLLNCGNSCYANVILQCLARTRPLVAYLLQRGHRRDCRRNEWCFFCELQCHIERASQSQQPFSPINILSRLPSIGGNLGYGKQEDAHEFMRFAIDTMQSICIDEHGGEKMIHPKSQETTFIQHTFGGQLQSQVICVQCNNVSNQFENMMDLTVEIEGGATSLEECLDQFTVKEWLHGDNLYKCDGCNDYVKAWKRLTIRQAPNILTIALKRFQGGRFGKLNKRITFPESLDLTPYMSEEGDGTDKYKLYAVVVHIDMLNASFFGHYICYIKDFRGSWFRVDDSKVVMVELDEVLSQGAYMLLYSRVCTRPTCLKTYEASRKLHREVDNMASKMKQNSPKEPLDLDSVEPIKSHNDFNSPASHIISHSNGSLLHKEPASQPAVRDIQVRENGGAVPRITPHSHSHHPNAGPTSLPSRVIRVKENEAISVDHVNGTISALVSSPKEAQSLTSGSLANGFTSLDSCALNYPSSDETSLVTHTSQSPILSKQHPEEAESERNPPMSTWNGSLDGEDAKRFPSINDSIMNGNGTGFGKKSGDLNSPTSLSTFHENFESSPNDGKADTLWINGSVNLGNGISSCNAVDENGFSNYSSVLDAPHSGLIHDQNEQCLNDMEVDAVETNGSLDLGNGLTSCILLDKIASSSSSGEAVPSSVYVEPSDRHSDEMDIDNGKFN